MKLQLIQAYTALYTGTIKASKNDEFLKLYTNNYKYGDELKQKLIEKSEGAKNEVELLDELASVISDTKLKINFEAMETNFVSSRYIELNELQDELFKLGIDVKQDYTSIVKDLQKKGIIISFLSKENLENNKNCTEVQLLLEWLKVKSEIQQFESLRDAQIDGFIKPTFNFWGSISGRVISHSPSTQNFPKYYKEYLLPLNEGEEIYELDIKSAEIIGLAFLSNEHKIFDLLSNGQDIYSYIFSMIFHVNEDDISQEKRNLAKKIVNGINLGLGIEGLKNIVNNSGLSKREVTDLEAKALRDKYYSLFPKFNNYMSNIIKADKLTTSLGFEIEVEPSYKNMSFPPQNIIATVIKTMVVSLMNYQNKLVNIVHDSIWVSANESDLEIIKDCMEKICSQLLPEEYLNKNIEFIKVTKLGGI